MLRYVNVNSYQLLDKYRLQILIMIRIFNLYKIICVYNYHLLFCSTIDFVSIIPNTYYI